MSNVHITHTATNQRPRCTGAVRMRSGPMADVLVLLLIMEVGALFDSFSDFESALRHYEIEQHVNYTKRDSTTVERGRRKQPRRTFK